MRFNHLILCIDLDFQWEGFTLLVLHAHYCHPCEFLLLLPGLELLVKIASFPEYDALVVTLMGPRLFRPLPLSELDHTIQGQALSMLRLITLEKLQGF